MVSSKKKFLKRFLRGTVVAIIVYITVSMLATKIIYDSVFQRYDAENIIAFEKITESDICRKEYSYACGEVSLKGALYSTKKSEYGLVLLIPGFKAEMKEYEGVIYALLREGFDVFSFDPTGHGESSGEDSVGFPQIINDVDSTLDFINKKLKYDKIFLLGHSRGGYGACCALNSDKNISAVVSVNGVDTAMDAIMAYSTQYVGTFAYGNYPFLSLYQNLVFGSELAQRSAVEEINKSDIPVLIIQAKNDESIPKEKYSLYSRRGDIVSSNAKTKIYNKSGFDGHKSILYDHKGTPNYDIIKQISAFYKKYNEENSI